MAAGRSITLEINRNVRRVLVSRWVDLGRLSINTVGTTVYLRGVLQKLPGSGAELNSAALENIYQKIRAISGVQNVQLQLENWERNGSTGAWEPRGQETESRGTEARSQEFKQATYRIGSE